MQAAKTDQFAQLWAFATTIYEIFSRCKEDLSTLRQEQLLRQKNLDGNILKMLDQDICPAPIFETIMDGWSDDETKRFSHHDIFSRLNTIKAEILPNYMPPPEIATSKLSRRKQRYEIGIHFIFYFFFQMELETRP